MANMRAQAQLFYDGTGAGTFGTVGTGTTCTGAGTTGTMFLDSSMTALVAGVIAQGTGTAFCQAGGQNWMMSIGLKGAGGFWCVDSSGTSKAEAAAPLAAATQCL
jgi:hypothetical protein